MNARNTLLMTCILALALVIPGHALAKDNYIDQGKFKSEAKTEENVANEWDSEQAPESGAAASASNCQLVVVAEVAIAALAASSALAVIDDEDEVTISEIPNDLHNIPEALTAETSDSTCSTPLGPILIDITTSAGWGASAPHGAASDVVGALDNGRHGGGGSGGGPSNAIDQGRFKMKAELKDNIANEWDGDQYDDNGNTAISASNCQAVVVARAAVLAVALGESDATIEDSDTVVVNGPGGVGTSDFVFNESNPNTGAFTEVMVLNNHLATSLCTQTIESVTIMIRPESPTIPPAS